MRIKIWGAEESINELNQKDLSGHEIITTDIDAGMMQQCDLFIDLHPDKFYSRLDLYEQFYPVPVLINCVKDTLAHIYSEYFGNKQRFSLFGYNALHSFINTPVAEVSVLHERYAEQLDELMKSLKWRYCLVDDHIGMVTPRMASLIINEAYFAVQEGTASREDIDRAMKLGANMPYGPFEWCKKIGVGQVYDLLGRLYQSTLDERYKMSALLRREYRLEMLNIKQSDPWL